MPRAAKIFLKITASFLFVFANSIISPAQDSIEDFRKILREKAAFSETDFSALGQGETVVKLLPADDEKEVAVCGIVRLQNVFDFSLADFQNSLKQKNNKTIVQGEMFSEPPAFEDLQSLTLDKSDLEAMKKCAVGNCKLKMSAAMINRLQTEIDWNAPDYKAQATRLFQQMLFEYIQDYSKRGNAALMQYDNRKNPVRLDEEHFYLLESALFLQDFAPEFADYLKNYPNSKLNLAENDFRWSKIKFGLKPMITITHTANYARQANGKPQFLIATRQIYASRYVDSSLALAMLVNVPVDGAEAETYIIFTNRSRSDALDGMFSELKRRVVEQEATDRVKEVLNQAKVRLESGAKNQSEPTDEIEKTEIQPHILDWLRNPLVQIFLLLSVAAVFVFLYRRRKQLIKSAAE